MYVAIFVHNVVRLTEIFQARHVSYSHKPLSTWNYSVILLSILLRAVRDAAFRAPQRPYHQAILRTVSALLLSFTLDCRVCDIFSSENYAFMRNAITMTGKSDADVADRNGVVGCHMISRIPDPRIDGSLCEINLNHFKPPISNHLVILTAMSRTSASALFVTASHHLGYKP